MNEWVEALRRAVDGLLAHVSPGDDPAELMALARDLETELRRLSAVQNAVVAGLARRDPIGPATTTAVLVHELRITPAEARARLRAAADLAPRQGLQGQTLPAIYDHVAAAQVRGVLSADHARVITDIVEHLPPTLLATTDTGDHTLETGIELALTDAAAHLDPVGLRRFAVELVTRLQARHDPDGPEPIDEVHRRDRRLHLHTRPDGSGDLRGHLDPATTAVWTTLLDSHSAPAPSDDGQRDPRTSGQRQHDAFGELGRRLLRSGELPTHGGHPVTVLAITTLDDPPTDARPDPAGRAEGPPGPVTLDSFGPVTTSYGHPLTTAQLGGFGDDLTGIPITRSRHGRILDLGRRQRLASPAQRLALTARDRGCTFPGCHQPPAHCQAHHVVPWTRNGPTDLDNLALLCGPHHREHAKQGWTSTMTDGMPRWHPPAWIDPGRTPRHNHAHSPTQALSRPTPPVGARTTNASGHSP